MPRKENTKAKTWERDRRKRMNAYFKTLADLLPPHQEGRKRNKVDILIHASKYIKDLHSRTEELFSTNASEAHKEELARLKKLVTQLMSRTQLLSTLLKEAGISVPAEPALEKISPLKWSNKINVDDVDKYFDKIEESKKKTLEKKKKEKSTENKVPSKRKSAPSASKKLSEEAVATKNVCNLIENQENRVNCANSKNYNSDSTSSLAGTESKQVERCQNDSANEATATGTGNTKKKTDKKVESQKSLKKKRKRKDEKNSTLPPMANTVTSLTPNTLILSGGKLMPLVAPMTSNIIVNTQQASTNPIILANPNTQQSQMIVMQPLANRVQNSVVSICNHALINTVQKVTLNTVPSIRANMVVDSHNWASNVKNIINATKIGGHKGILPKGKEITKTTMAYKVPIPAIHKEKVEKPKDNANKKESEVKAKGNKNHSKNHKSVQSTPEMTEELNVEKKLSKEPAKTNEDITVPRKGALKRSLSAESDSANEPEDKKRKDTNDEAKSPQPIASKATDFTPTCKSIANLKHVIERIGENIRDEHAVSNEKESTTITKSSTVVTQTANDTDCEETSATSKLMDIVDDTNCFDNKKTTEDVSQTVVSDKFPSESEADAPDRSSNDFNISIDNITEKSNENIEHLDAKSTLTDVEVAEKAVGSDGLKKTCNLGTRFDSLLRVATAKEQQQINDAMGGAESNKIILNLDTNTTTTMKSDASIVDAVTSASASSSSLSSSSSPPLTTNVVNDEAKLTKTSKDEISKSLSYTNENTFVPISNRTDELHSDLSNDIFASLPFPHVPSSSHNPESISPTAAFLMAFPLVSSLNGKTEVLDEEMKDDFKYHSQTPPMLLQIGTMEPNSFKIKTSSPSHAIAEKRLKTSCEEKQIASTNVNTDIIVPVECATTKSLPKVVNEETLREPYKIVQTVLTSSLEKSVMTTNAFPSHTSVNFSAVDSSCIVGNSPNLATNQVRSDQLRTTNALNSVNVIASQAPVNISASTDKSDIVDCTSSQVTTSRNPDVAYSGQDFLPSSTMVGNGLGTLQHTSNSSMFKNAIATTQESNPTVGPHVDNVDDSQNLLGTRLENATVTTNSSSTTLRPLQTDYSTQTKDKGSQSSSHVIYPSHNKDTIIDSVSIVPDHRVDYASQMDRGLPVTSQSMQNYTVPPKESSLSILPSQDMQHMYNQTKDSHVLLDLNNSQQTFNVQKKQEHIIASSRNDYVGNQAKAISQKDSISYTNGDNEAASAPSRNQEYVTKTASQSSSENTFQRNYSKLNKSTDTLNPNQETKLNDVLSSKTQEQQQHNHVRDPAYVPAKKLDIDQFVQSYQYHIKEPISNLSERTNVLNANTDDTHNNYVSYPSKDDKKTNAVSTIAMANNNKSVAVQQSSVARYSQQTSSFIATSNYEQSTMTENHTKSTTTVAHNSSNFSILSWTTFSPVSGGGGGGNNNLVHYYQGHSNDNAEAKTICENYSYVPLHKDNSTFPNQVLIGDNYPNSSTMSAGIEKSRQGKIESQKQSFVDPSKTRSDSSKQNRMQSQQTGNDYKFPDSGKSKNKYGMDSDYMQNEYNAAMDQQQQHSQQHGQQKNHQNLSSKQEKAVYTYEPQLNFDLAESNVQMKYSIEAYTGVNFKYAEKTQQPSQHKYQILTQGQVSLHDNSSYSSDVKHSQQQQQQPHSSNNNGNNKSKSNQHQQHAIKAPVNWMMTPEVKHNTNIDIILPPIGKELDFCQNNLFTQTPTYNQGTPNQFYNNYDVPAAHNFPNLPVLQSDPKRSAETFYSEDQPFPWSPTKNSVHSVEHTSSQSSVKCIDQHIVPSSLQSLVGDLDLSTNLEKQNFLFGGTSLPRISAEQSKDAPIKEKETNNVSGRDLHAILNTQNAQHPASTFLSVSQLVEHEKAEKNQQQNHQQHQHHQHHHPHQHQHSQQQHQQQQQARKHQRKSNASPRTTSKRQMDIRKSTTTNDNNNLHQRHEEQKSSGHVFTEQGYQQPQQQQQQQQQQQKYQQNNVHWRGRNCKSNYTAEALIGTSIHDAGQDKHASIKFTTNYPQNKFQSGLSDAAVMPINYFSSAPSDDGTAGYGQSVVNQNFNTYAYSSNSANSIYPTSNFISSISNTPNGYMAMPLHENATDYVQDTNFLLPNVAGTSSSSSASTANTSSANTTSTTTGNTNGNGKNHQHYGKHPNCDKRSYSTAAKKGKRKALESGPMQNLEFPLTGINSPLEEYHHSTTFLAPPPPAPPPPPHANLYQNHPQTNVYTKTVNGLPPPPPSAMASAQGVAAVGAPGFSMNSNMVRGGIVSSNPMAMPHHPSGTSLTNFNLSTIFPEMNDKVTGYKSSNGIPPGLSQTSNQPATYAQRSNYPSNSLCHLPQVSEGTQFINSVPPLPVPPAPPPAAPSLSHGVIHYKNL